MTRANLIERLNFEGTTVYLDGTVIFSGLGIPLNNPVDNEVNLLGVTPERTVYQSSRQEPGKEEPIFTDPIQTRVIYVGSGGCCEGPISILTSGHKEGEKEDFKLDSVKLPSFNVFDILPVVFGDTDQLDGERYGLLATGYGCHGRGVKLIGRDCSGYLEVVPSHEFRDLWDKRTQNWVAPRLTVSDQTKRITLNLLKSGYRLKPGHRRNPNIPEFLIDNNYETYVSQDIHASKDLTSRLVELGVDIEKTIEANEGYVRIRRSR
mgnify:FL=1